MTLRTSVLALVLLLSVSASVAGNEGCADPADISAKGPDTFEARFETSQGDFVIEVNRAWAPSAADRFYNLVKIGYYDNVRFLPLMPGYAVQFPIHSGPPALATWKDQTTQADPARESNQAGFVTFAKGAKNSLSTQVFINLGDNSRLDAQGLAPFGKVTEGMEVVAKLNSELPAYVDSSQGKPKAPELDFIRKASVVDEPEPEPED